MGCCTLLGLGRILLVRCKERSGRCKESRCKGRCGKGWKGMEDAKLDEDASVVQSCGRDADAMRVRRVNGWMDARTDGWIYGGGIKSTMRGI